MMPFAAMRLRKPFTPASLFAAGEQGAWYDPSDFSTMFQDSAGTTPVTATTQPVGKMLDKSGRGNHLLQATSAARPTLQQDASGYYYLSGDGVDDSLGATGIAFGVNYYTGVAMSVTGGGSFPGPFRILRSGGSATAATDNLLEEYSPVASLTSKNVVQRYPSLAVMTSATGLRPASGVAHVSWNNNGGTGASRHGVIYAGSANGDLAASAPTLTAGSGATLSLFRGYSGNVMAGRIYGFVYVGPRAINASELAQTNLYLMGKSGVTS